MKARELPLFIPPPPVEPPACGCCKVFRPECIVPMGDGALPMCWLCAHHVVEHNCTLEEAVEHECECLPTEIFPRSRFGDQFEAQRDEIIARRNEA